LFKLFADLRLEAALGRLVPPGRLHAFGKIRLPRGVGIGLVVRVAVAFAVAEVLHQPGRGVAQVHRHRPRRVRRDEIAGRIIGVVDRGGLRRHREVDHRLGERELAFRAAEPLIGLAGVERHAQRAGVGEADVLHRHADHAPADIQRIGAAVEHAHHPVERGVGIRAAHRLVQRRDLVVELLAALVEAPEVLRQRLLDELPVDRLALGRGVQDLHRVEQPAGIAVGEADQARFRLVCQLYF